PAAARRRRSGKRRLSSRFRITEIPGPADNGVSPLPLRFPMLIIVGLLVVVLSVLGGYVGAHGKLGALWQPFELVIIGGAALGAFLVGTPAKTVRQTLRAVVGVFKGPRYKRDDYLDVLSLLYEL